MKKPLSLVLTTCSVCSDLSRNKMPPEIDNSIHVLSVNTFDSSASKRQQTETRSYTVEEAFKVIGSAKN